jgi:hypothetical protein
MHAAVFCTAPVCSESTDPFTGARQQAPSLTLVPEVGKPASVTIMNIYAGQVGGRWHVRHMCYSAHSVPKVNCFDPESQQPALLREMHWLAS